MSLIPALLFSLVGMVVFKQGKDAASVRRMLLGAALMGYSYLTPNAALSWLVGSLLTATVILGGD